VTFDILRAELIRPAADTGSFIYAGGEQTYVPAGLTDEMTVTNAGRTNVGSQTVTVSITDKRNYQWMGGGQEDVKFTFTISPKNISGAVIDPIEDQIHTGTPLTPEITVRVGDTVLIKDVDYTAYYANNIRSGTAVVTITGTGNYTGMVTTAFSIELVDPDNVNEWGTTAGIGSIAFLLLLSFIGIRTRRRM
jgi:hypothetical protein